MFLCLFVSSLTLIFSFIFSGLSVIYRRDNAKVSDKLASQFGSKGSNDGQFSDPFSVSCNSRGVIVVADFNNDRIQVFDRKGKFLFKFGSEGKRKWSV